jgi:hypothetical protein
MRLVVIRHSTPVRPTLPRSSHRSTSSSQQPCLNQERIVSRSAESKSRLATVPSWSRIPTMWHSAAERCDDWTQEPPN